MRGLPICSSDLISMLLINPLEISGGSRGHPGRGPPSALSNFFQVKKILSYDHALSANFLFFILGIELNAMANGQLAIHFYVCALENRSFNINFTGHARPFTLNSEPTVAHACQYDIILYYSMWYTVL